MAMRDFLRNQRLTFEDVRDFVLIMLFIGTLAVWAALGAGA